ncbi:Protein of unknown function (DUF3558) [Goodfellowiella coeruleoviolacea]|uniref:DUF3558 domain-containing protein n=1 Tax=Goodfellowiella coeruleoviolacea TaxID=334858 RepID=A0AAE3GGK4_9PSEU|nr:Protein of unknown function (DUF3558) [Goodfellowiella coeruleoviolacea]
MTACCAVGALVACGATEDLAKKTFPRTTVPAARHDPASPATSRSTAPSGEPADPAFTPDKLRLVDPCQLLDTSVLAELGTPAKADPEGFSECNNFMQDKQGKDLSISVSVGDTFTTEVAQATTKIGGLWAAESELEDSGACFVNLILQDNPGLGITIQTGYDHGDPCEPARTVAESVADRMTRGAPTRTPQPGSLITVDPCTVVGAGPISEVVGDKRDLFAYGLYHCSWDGSNGVELSLDLREAYDPKDDGVASVDLGGGHTAYQRADNNSYPSCELSWVHRPINGDGLGEVVEVQVDNIDNIQLDVCAKAQGFARALLPALPTA